MKVEIVKYEDGAESRRLKVITGTVIVTASPPRHGAEAFVLNVNHMDPSKGSVAVTLSRGQFADLIAHAAALLTREAT